MYPCRSLTGGEVFWVKELRGKQKGGRGKNEKPIWRRSKGKEADKGINMVESDIVGGEGDANE